VEAAMAVLYEYIAPGAMAQTRRDRCRLFDWVKRLAREQAL